MPPPPTKFEPTSRIRNGKNGLANTAGSWSHVKITGTDLDNGLCVKVYDPLGSGTVVWQGDTEGTNGPKNKCHAKLKNMSTVAASQGRHGEGEINVGVTVGGSTPQQPFQVLTGPPLDGSYAIACNGMGGANKWLAAVGTTGVNLAGGNSGPTWVLTLIPNNEGNCYTIQIPINGTNYYLQWVNDGPTNTNISLVTATGQGTTWVLNNDYITAYQGSPAPSSPYMSGDVAAGTVTMYQQPSSNGSSWSVGTSSPQRGA